MVEHPFIPTFAPVRLLRAAEERAERAERERDDLRAMLRDVPEGAHLARVRGERDALSAEVAALTRQLSAAIAERDAARVELRQFKAAVRRAAGRP